MISYRCSTIIAATLLDGYHPYRRPDRYYNKKPWPLGICTIPNEVGLGGREPTRLMVKWVLGPQNPLKCELCKFTMARDSCFYPMNVFIVWYGKIQGVQSSWGIRTIRHTAY